MNKVVEYIRNWNECQPKGKGVKMMPLNYGDDVYGIEIRFPGTAYRCSEDDFLDLRGILARRSGGALIASSTFADFRSGILSIDVAFCNNAYSPNRAVRALEELITEIIPSFKL